MSHIQHRIAATKCESSCLRQSVWLVHVHEAVVALVAANGACTASRANYSLCSTVRTSSTSLRRSSSSKASDLESTPEMSRTLTSARLSTDSIDHLVTVHDFFSAEVKPMIQNYIATRVRCLSKSECRHLTNRKQRKRENVSRTERNEHALVSTLCEVVGDALEGASLLSPSPRRPTLSDCGRQRQQMSRFATDVHPVKEEEDTKDDAAHRM